jgi:hypothetical protein
MQCGSYYQAIVKKEKAWFFTALLRGCEHIAFDRTVDVEKSLFEFFVPRDTEPYFLEIMHYFESQGLVKDMRKQPNRLCRDTNTQ